MAVKEITEQEYNHVKRDLDKGVTKEDVAFEHSFGQRRVRLIARSKSYKSYLALRRVERTKAAQNTPAKPAAGKHELHQEPPVVESVVDELIETPRKEDKQRDELQTVPPITIKAQPKRKQSDTEFMTDVFFYGILTFAVLGVVATIWFIAARVF